VLVVCAPNRVVEATVCEGHVEPGRMGRHERLVVCGILGVPKDPPVRAGVLRKPLERGELSGTRCSPHSTRSRRRGRRAVPAASKALGVPKSALLALLAQMFRFHGTA
jgi:hypothetical protein